jgi:hypothetical protein
LTRIIKGKLLISRRRPKLPPITIAYTLVMSILTSDRTIKRKKRISRKSRRGEAEGRRKKEKWKIKMADYIVLAKNRTAKKNVESFYL